MPTIVYKVVRAKNDEYISCFAPDEYRMTYRLNETTTPLPNTYLYAFKYLDNAINFAECDPRLVILLCEADIYPNPLPRIAPAGMSYSDFWTNPHRLGVHAPLGTCLCTSITPIKEAYPKPPSF